MRFWDYASAALALLVLLGALHMTDKVVQGLEARCDLVAPSGD